jgi:hypothetical protein
MKVKDVIKLIEMEKYLIVVESVLPGEVLV